MYLLNKKNILLCGMLLTSALHCINSQSGFIGHVQKNTKKLGGEVSELAFFTKDIAASSVGSILNVVLTMLPMAVGGVAAWKTYEYADKFARQYFYNQFLKALKEKNPDKSLSRLEYYARFQVEKYFNKLSTPQKVAYKLFLASIAFVVFGVVWQVGDYIIHPVIEKKHLKPLDEVTKFALKQVDAAGQLSMKDGKPDLSGFIYKEFWKDLYDKGLIKEGFNIIENAQIKELTKNIEALAKDENVEKGVKAQLPSMETLKGIVKEEERNFISVAQGIMRAMAGLKKKAPINDYAWGNDAINKLKIDIKQTAEGSYDWFNVSAAYLLEETTNFHGQVPAADFGEHSWDSLNENKILDTMKNVTFMGLKYAVPSGIVAVPGYCYAFFKGSGEGSDDLEEDPLEAERKHVLDVDKKLAAFEVTMEDLAEQIDTIEKEESGLVAKTLKRKLDSTNRALNTALKNLQKSVIVTSEEDYEECKEKILVLQKRVNVLAENRKIKLAPIKSPKDEFAEIQKGMMALFGGGADNTSDEQA